MATTVTNSSAQGPRPLSGDATTDTVAATSVVAQDEPSCEASEGITEKVMPPPRPLMIYTRPQILLLHRSPLVKPPLDMPSLRDWFGLVFMNSDCLCTYAAPGWRTNHPRKNRNLRRRDLQETDGNYLTNKLNLFGASHFFLF